MLTKRTAKAAKPAEVVTEIIVKTAVNIMVIAAHENIETNQ